MKRAATFQGNRNKQIRSSIYFLIRLPVIIGVLLGASCGKKSADANAKQQQVAPVTAATVIEREAPVEIHAVGNVEAYLTVSVKSRVSGYILGVHFDIGQDVKKGNLLYTIDPNLYKVALKQAKANLAKDVVQLENARKQAERDVTLLQKGLASQEESDQTRTNAEALVNQVAADRATVENAKLQLSYCHIASPITGRAGDILINEGNLINANGEVLVVINQVQPIYVSFSVPAQYLAEIIKRKAEDTLTVEATIPQSDAAPQVGELAFLDNTIDTSTGTIHLKGAFENKDRLLWPGQFVDVKLKLSTRPHAVIVPSRAVMTGQKGQYVFVIKKDLTVEMRDVTTDFEIEGDTVIQKGLRAGEQVVTDGQLRLVGGSKVSIKNPSQEAAGRKG